MKRVLIFTDYYKPAVKGGGPIQSISNMVESLSHKVDFKIIAGDRDLGDYESFDLIKNNTWINDFGTKIYYTNIKKLNVIKLLSILKEIEFDIVYLNSFFSLKTSFFPILLYKFGLLKNKTVVLAPRGEFSQGAMDIKKYKKIIFIIFSKLFNFHKEVVWHATADIEREDIKRYFRRTPRIVVANNITKNNEGTTFHKNITKRKRKLSIVFISRIHPKKNLKTAIKLLKDIEGTIEFNIYGPIENQKYWADCQAIIKHLPSNIHVSYGGVLNHSEVANVFSTHHVFLFPTFGENFGHVISESLINGCPVLISDQTPWQNLSQHRAGFDIPLKNLNEFSKKIQKFVDMSQKEYLVWAKAAFEFGINKSSQKSDIEDVYNLFNDIE